MISSLKRQDLSLLLGPVTLRILSLIVVFTIWEFGGRTNPLIMSYPSAILQAGIATFSRDIVPAFIETLKGFGAGFGLAILIGVPVGFLMSRSKLLDLSISPYVTALYATPRVALIPVLILWLGIGFDLRVGVVLISGLFPIILNTYLGGKEVNRDLLDVGNAFAATKFQRLRTIVVPASLPFVYAGLRIGIARALIGAIVAELQISSGGIGGLIKTHAKKLRIAEMFAPIIILGIFSIVLVAAVRWAERRTTMPWLWQAKGD